ncbi:MAG TPA: AMP-binding protein [Terriglobales bacterium]|nr:AMP-binding protein [Terriglobales bacterium]
MANFYSRFLQSVEQFPSIVAVEFQKESGELERYTYADMRRMSDSVGNWLLSQGVPRGTRCAILANNGPRWVATYLGILAAGAVAVPFDTAFTSDQVAKLLLDSGADFLFVDAKHLPTAKEALKKAPVNLLLTQRIDGEERPNFDAMQQQGPGDFRYVDLGFDDMAAILYTSGTTSDPKGVMLTHGSIAAEAEGAFRLVTDLGPSDALLGILPLFHALAQMANLLLPLVTGARVVFLEALNTTELMKALRERGITIFCCVPQFFYLIHGRIMKEVSARGRLTEKAFGMMLKTSSLLRKLGINIGPVLFGKVHQMLGSKMRYLITGGSRLDPQVGRDFYAMGYTILNAYGLTETSGAATVTRPNNNVIGSVGQPMYGVEVKIVNPQLDSEIGREVGEIAVRGGVVMKGYYNRPDATAAVMQDGWLLTGDVGYLDEGNNLFITGRAKEIIVLSSGKNIYPEEIEAHFQRSPFVKEVCVIGLEGKPGEPLSERLHGVIVPNFEVLRERKIVNAKEIVRFEIETLSAQLPATKRILSYDIWQEDLPRTTTRKLKRREVEKKIRSGESTSVGEQTTTRDLSDADRDWLDIPEVAQAIPVIRSAAKTKREHIFPSDSLELDLGLDSMERVELLVALEKELGAFVEDSVVSEVYTVRELVDAVRARIGATGTRESSQSWAGMLAEDPTEPEILAIARPHPVSTIVWYLISRVFLLIGVFFFRMQVRGKERLPKQGPFILSPNHQSYLDAPALLGLLPWRVFKRQFSVGTSEIFGTGIARKIAYTLNLVPVDPDANLVPAMKAGSYGLRHGKVLILFPEGERSIDGSPKKFKKGAAILSANLNVPIVPIALSGFHEAWPRGKGFQGFTKLRVVFGEPIYPGDKPEDEAVYESLTTELRNRVLKMWEEAQAQQAQPEMAR